MEDLRTVERKENNSWVKIDYMELKKGDTFRMFESTGEPVINRNYGNPRTEFLATSELYIIDEKTQQVGIDIEGGIS